VDTDGLVEAKLLARDTRNIDHFGATPPYRVATGRVSLEQCSSLEVTGTSCWHVKPFLHYGYLFGPCALGNGTAGVHI